MPFRRRDAKSMKKSSINRAVEMVCERLEQRTLLTALVNGTFQGTGTIFDGQTFFDYAQPGGGTVRISVFGNVTAEFIGGAFTPSISPTASQVTLSDLQPAGTQTPTVWLFSIYVVHSDINSAISIAELTGTPAEMDPFTGTQAIRVINATSGTSGIANFAGNSVGGVYIGAKTAGFTDATLNNIPLTWADQRKFGMRPSSAGELFSGLEIAPGNDLGKFFLGGAITGLVDVPGNMQEFYAGAVLTGDARGMLSTDDTSEPTFFPNDNSPHFPHKNFHIGGNIDDLLSGTSFGTSTLTGAPNGIPYKTGFQLDIDGRVGEVESLDSFLGQAVIHNGTSVSGTGLAQNEFEVRGATLPQGDSYFDPFDQGYNIAVSDNGAPSTFTNDTFATAQFLGTERSHALASDDVIQLKGELDNAPTVGDDTDYYAVPLLAGQTMTVQMLDDYVGVTDAAAIAGLHVHMAVFDPDGRMIYTDYSDVDPLALDNAPVSITADRPGAYRIALAYEGNTTFASGVAGNLIGFLNPYELRIRKVADIALGGLIAATGSIATTDENLTTGLLDKSIQVLRDDLGAVEAPAGTIFSEAAPWYVPTGNIRDVVAASIGSGGTGVTEFLESGPDFLVRKGSIGLLRATSATGWLTVDDDIATYGTAADLGAISSTVAVGDAIQYVDAAGDLGGELLSNGAIGVIHAGSVGNLGEAQPVFMANVNQNGSDGIIDLIDCTGVFNGPAIATGPNGDLRYLNVPAGNLIRDRLFGGGTPELPTIYTPGKKVTLTDDDGTRVTLTPLPIVSTNGAATGSITPTTLVNPPQLSVLTYPIRGQSFGGAGGGGVVIVNVTVIPNVPNFTSTLPGSTGGGGLEVDSGTGEGVEIDSIDVSGTDTNVPAFDPFLRKYVFPTPAPSPRPRPINLLFGGKARVDIWNITETTPGATITSIVNNTSGEIVGINGPALGTTVNAPNVLLLQAQTLGLAESHTGMAVIGATPLAGLVYPFLNQTTAITVNNLVEADARGGLGNIVAANIGTLVANSDGVEDKGVFEGINAPIVSGTDGQAANNLTGNIVSIRIGDGVLPSGSGAVAFSGIFAAGQIDSIVGSGVGHDIRGTVDAEGLVVPTTVTVTNATGIAVTESTPSWIIGSIRLNGGSIVDANIETNNTFLATSETAPGGFSTSLSQFFDTPTFDIGEIQLKGTGGIIGSLFLTANMGFLTVSGGFGVLNSEFVTTNDSTFEGIVTDGYGIRNVISEGGGALQKLIANGNGKTVSTLSYSPSVRYSEKDQFDPFSGEALSPLNDLHKFLGTTAANPKIKGTSATGIIADSIFNGSRTLDTVQAYRIQARDPFLIEPSTNAKLPIPLTNAAYPMQLQFGNSINKITVGDSIDGLAMTTGTLNSLSVAGDVLHTTVSAASLIKSISAGALRGGSSIFVTGSNGKINSITTKHSLYSTINVSGGGIGSINVGTDIGSPLIHSGGNIGTLNVKGSILTGAKVETSKHLVDLIIGGDVQAGATIQAAAIDKQTIKGQVIGDIIT